MSCLVMLEIHHSGHAAQSQISFNTAYHIHPISALHKNLLLCSSFTVLIEYKFLCSCETVAYL